MTRLSASCVLLFATLLRGASWCIASATLTVSPAETVIDEPIRILVDGLQPRQEFVIRAVAPIDSQKALVSHARFRADEAGKAEVEKLEPLEGTYRQGWMGILWSMTEDTLPLRLKDVTTSPYKPPAMFRILFELEVDGQIVSSASLSRSFVRADVRMDEVRERGVVGRLFRPAVTGKAPAIIVVGGSEGGMESAEYWAKLLASHGYCAIALAYFRAEGLPNQLAGIPVETVKSALDYLAVRPEVDADRIAILGSSRGSELALLAGAAFPRIKAVVAYSPSNSSWGALASGPQKAAWTIDGNPVPFVPYPPRELISGIKDMPSRLPPLLQGLFLSYSHAVQRAEIPVEKINGGIILISGKEDRIWPSSAMSDLIVARLRENGFRYPVVNLSYEGAGHLIDFPFFPTPSRIELGGTPEGLANADADSWSRVLEFFDSNLHQPKSKDHL
jgi:dienelactone hydrolase